MRPKPKLTPLQRRAARMTRAGGGRRLQDQLQPEPSLRLRAALIRRGLCIDEDTLSLVTICCFQ